MTLNTLIIIIIVFWAVLLVTGLLVGIFLLGRHTVRNNPNNALILVKSGLETIAFKGKLHEKTSRGINYLYSKGSIFVPNRYQEVYHKNKRLLFINRIGQLIASPFDTDVALTDSEKENLIYELVSGHIGSDGLRALKGKGTLNVIIIAIVAFIVGAIIVFGIFSYQNAMKSKPVNTQTQQQIQPILPAPIEVK